MIPRSDITDLERATFIEKLSEAARADKLLLSPWALDFIDSYNKSYRYWKWMTPGRRVKCDELRGEYGALPEIGMPLPMAKSSPVKPPEADAGCCMFLKRNDDHRLVPCNGPAAWRRQNGFLYCDACADNVRRDLKRTGKTIHLIPFKA